MPDAIVIAIPDGEMRTTLRGLLECLHADLFWADSIPELLARVDDVSPDVLVLDLGMCSESPELLIGTLRRKSPSTRIVACSSESDPKDAAVIEKGIFYYAAGMDAAQLAEVVRAALHRKSGASRF